MKEIVQQLDIDFDTQASRRKKILSAVKEFFNPESIEKYQMLLPNWNVLNIATFGTEGTKSAILASARGYRSEEFPNGIDNDIAQYLTSMIPQERGKLWSIQDCIFGNKEKGRKPIKLLKDELDKYDGLLNIILSIENLVNKRSSHASGVYIYNNGFLEYNAMMKTPSGLPITQYDMSDSDYMGSLKYDFLTIESTDKIRACLDLLLKNKKIEWQGSLKETYLKYLSPEILDCNDEELWKIASNGEMIGLFQFDTDVGLKCIKKLKPKTLSEAASANSLMRLMADKGEEQPMDRFIRMRDNIKIWYNEMKSNGLTEDEIKLLEPHYLPVYGTPNTQEDMMEVLLDEHITNFDLVLSNKARKVVAKKHTDEIEQLSKTFYEKGAEVGSRKVFLDYIWKTCIKPQLGYSFSRCHVTPYTFIALQELTLYKKYGAIFWNTACLIVDSGATDADDEEKQKNTDYSKIATAIGEMMSRGINVSLVDINKSMSSFYPDEKNNTILFGIKGINSINKDELIQEIINNRPYKTMEDFLSKVKVNKTMMINLIKSGAFDNLYKKPRVEIMKEYITSICGIKKVLNLRNFNSLIDEELVPQELDDTAKIYKFTKFIKKNCKVDNFFSLQNEELYSFYCDNFDQDLLINNNGVYMVNQKTYEKLYKKEMDKARNWLKENQEEVLNKYNNLLFEKEWNKNCLGNISKWEMDSVSFYYHEHELKNVDLKFYGIQNFSQIKSNDVEMIFKNKYPIYKLTKIIGTVIGKDKAKGSIKLLTTEGVVPIRFRKEYFAQFDKQISQKQPDGTKKVIEKSWFNKGSKIMVMGYRRDNEFVPKKYSKTVGHMLYKIISVDDKGKMQLIDTRSNEGFEEESDE